MSVCVCDSQHYSLQSDFCAIVCASFSLYTCTNMPILNRKQLCLCALHRESDYIAYIDSIVARKL